MPVLLRRYEFRFGFCRTESCLNSTHKIATMHEQLFVTLLGGGILSQTALCLYIYTYVHIIYMYISVQVHIL